MRIYSFIQVFMETYYVPSTILSTENIAKEKNTHKILALDGRRDTNRISK